MDLTKIRSQLIQHEGYKTHLYKDSVGLWTIGVGHNIEERGLSDRAIQVILDDDIAEAVADLERNLNYFSELPISCQNALVNLSFNLGIARLLQFKKMLIALKNNDWATAADELLDSRYATQVGQRALDVAEMIRYPT